MGRIGSWLGEMIGNSAGEIIEKTGETVDRFVHTGGKKHNGSWQNKSFS